MMNIIPDILESTECRGSCRNRVPQNRGLDGEAPRLAEESCHDAPPQTLPPFWQTEGVLVESVGSVRDLPKNACRWRRPCVSGERDCLQVLEPCSQGLVDGLGQSSRRTALLSSRHGGSRLLSLQSSAFLGHDTRNRLSDGRVPRHLAQHLVIVVELLVIFAPQLHPATRKHSRSGPENGLQGIPACATQLVKVAHALILCVHLHHDVTHGVFCCA
jgi:hypothetical protein